MVLINIPFALDLQCFPISEVREVGNVIFMRHGGSGMTTCVFVGLFVVGFFWLFFIFFCVCDFCLFGFGFFFLFL